MQIYALSPSKTIPPSPSYTAVFIIPFFAAICKPRRREKNDADFGKTVDSRAKVWYNRMKKYVSRAGCAQAITEESQVFFMNQDELNGTPDETEYDFSDEPILPEGVDRAEMRRVNGMSRLFDFVEMLVLTVAVVLLLSSFLVRHTLVQGGSMNNTLLNGQHLLISDTNYEPKNGDVIVFVPLNQTNRSTPFIKRVIAVGGQTVEIRSGVVLVDQIAQSEEYLSLSKGHADYPETVVPDGYVFVLGDNRTNSRDSRYEDVGMVDVRSILGRVLCRVWPISSAGRIE